MVASTAKLVYVQEVFRHGARYPIYPSKADGTDYALLEDRVGIDWLYCRIADFGGKANALSPRTAHLSRVLDELESGLYHQFFADLREEHQHKSVHSWLIQDHRKRLEPPDGYAGEAGPSDPDGCRSRASTASMVGHQ